MSEGRTPEETERIILAEDAVEHIHRAQEYLAMVGGMDATLESLEEEIRVIRRDIRSTGPVDEGLVKKHHEHVWSDRFIGGQECLICHRPWHEVKAEREARADGR